MEQLEHVTAEGIAQWGVVAAPDRLIGRAQDNKMVFDRLVREYVVEIINQLVDRANALAETEENRTEQEELRVAAELLRVAAEEARELAEAARRAAEAARADEHTGLVAQATAQAERAEQAAQGAVEAAKEDLAGYATQAQSAAQNARASASAAVNAKEAAQASAEAAQTAQAGVESAAQSAALSAEKAAAQADRVAEIAGEDVVTATELEQILEEQVAAVKQDKIQAVGILKGDGEGGVTAGVPGEDYLTPANLEGLTLTDGSVTTDKLAQDVQDDLKGLLEAVSSGDIGIDPKVCQALGLSEGANLNDAMFALAIGVGKYAFTLTVAHGDSMPVAGAVITGDVTALDGGADIVTDDNGQATVISDRAAVTVEVASPYIDVEGTSLLLIATPIPSPGAETYKLLEYIESSGTQYIDTGVMANTISAATVDFQLASVGTAEVEVLAAYVGNASRLQCGWAGSAFMVAGGFSYSQTASAAARTVGTSTGSVGAPALSAYLFAQHESTGAKWLSSAKLYACRISAGGALARDYLPAKRVSDGAVGLYDIVEGKFYVNGGTGEFVAGPETGVTLTDGAAQKVTNVDVTLDYLNYVELTQSATVRVSDACTRVDVACGAAGQAGYGAGDDAARGGNGGNVAIQENVDFTPETDYEVLIGAGGAQYGATGGDTSALGVVASGDNNGIGGSGQTTYDSPTAGTAGTQQIFAGFTTMKPYGGGGGGGQKSDAAAKAGGAPGGGYGGRGGADYNGSKGVNGLGGGGGGGGRYRDYYGKGGSGGTGLCCLRMWHGEEDMA